MDEVTGERKTK